MTVQGNGQPDMRKGIPCSYRVRMVEQKSACSMQCHWRTPSERLGEWDAHPTLKERVGKNVILHTELCRKKYLERTKRTRRKNKRKEYAKEEEETTRKRREKRHTEIKVGKSLQGRHGGAQSRPLAVALWGPPSERRISRHDPLSRKKHWAQSDPLTNSIRFTTGEDSQRGEGKDKRKAYKVGMVEYNSVCSLQRCQGLPQRAAGDEVAVPKVRDGVDHHNIQVTFYR